tara:strand:- start:1025 stop:1270 length:246 start_codon:yes stop_codon:yes gene_type:complete
MFIMNDYVYLSVKLYLKNGQTEDSIQDIVSEVDYSFDHPQIVEHEIIEILDTNTGSESDEDQYVDVYDMNNYSDEEYDYDA